MKYKKSNSMFFRGIIPLYQNQFGRVLLFTAIATAVVVYGFLIHTTLSLLICGLVYVAFLICFLFLFFFLPIRKVLNAKLDTIYDEHQGVSFSSMNRLVFILSICPITNVRKKIYARIVQCTNDVKNIARSHVAIYDHVSTFDTLISFVKYCEAEEFAHCFVYNHRKPIEYSYVMDQLRFKITDSELLSGYVESLFNSPINVRKNPEVIRDELFKEIQKNEIFSNLICKDMFTKLIHERIDLYSSKTK